MSRFAFALALGACACQVVLGIGDKRTESPAPSCGSHEVPNGPHLRIANLVADETRVAVCLKADADGRSVRVPAAEAGCPDGVAYAEVSAPVALSPGSYQARLVEAGATCDAASLVESHVVIGDSGDTLVRLGGASHAVELRDYADSAPIAGSYRARFIHAAPNDSTLDLGFGDAQGVPANVATLVLPGIEFGETAAPGPSAVAGLNVDGHGYLANFLDVSFAAAPSGSNDARFVWNIVALKSLGQNYTLFAIGGDADQPRASLICNEQSVVGGLTDCTTGEPFDAKLELFSATLAGLLLAYPDERKAELLDRIGDFGSDAICVEEVWMGTARDEIAAAAKPVYPYQVKANLDLHTPFSDATGLDGTVPPPRTESYCPDAAAQSALDSLLDCIRANCASPATDDGYVTDSACGTTKCITQAISVPLECGACALVLLTGSTLAETRQICEQENDPLAFGGRSGVLLLSKYPLEQTESFVAPSTLFRREILHGRMRLPTGAAADIYCGHSPQVPTQSTLYPGVYGGGATGTEAWRNERQLFFQKLFAWVEATSRAPRRLVMGVFGTSPAGGSNFGALEPADFELLTQHFPLAAPADFVPTCTICKDSPLVTVPPLFSDLVLYDGAAEPLQAEITHTEPVVQVTDSLGKPLTVPLSGHYGFRSTLRLTP